MNQSLESVAVRLMLAWEMGHEDEYRALCNPAVSMRIPAYGVEAQGFEAVWRIRASMRAVAEGPLDIHTLAAPAVVGSRLTAVAHVISRATGEFTQHSLVSMMFDDEGRLVSYVQDVFWPKR